MCTHPLCVQFLWWGVVVLGSAVIEVDAQRVSPLRNGWGGDIITLSQLDRSAQAPVDTQWTLNFHLSIRQLHNQAQQKTSVSEERSFYKYFAKFGCIMLASKQSSFDKQLGYHFRDRKTWLQMNHYACMCVCVYERERERERERE